MGFERPNVYRLTVEGAGLERKDLCMEFQASKGAPIVSCWVETFSRASYSPDTGFTDGGFEQTRRAYVYGSELLKRKRVTTADMACFNLANALAKEAVVGAAAGDLVHTVLFDWFLKGPKHLTRDIAAAAPEWWKVMQRFIREAREANR